MVSKEHKQTPITTQALQDVAFNTIDIINGWEESLVLAADLAGLHALNIGKVDEDSLIFPI